MPRRTSGRQNKVQRRPPGYPPRYELRDLAAKVSEGAIATLDLVHATSVGWAEKIITTGLLQTKRCWIFKQNLVYFYVGRPEFRAADPDVGRDQITWFPAVFIVRPDNLGSPHHVYPFDTGAVWKGLYDGAIDPTVWLDDYELERVAPAVKRHIKWAFGSNANYFDGEIKNGIGASLPHWQTVARSFFKIVATASIANDRPDRRASAVEVAYGENVKLAHNAWLVILPKQFLEHDGRGKNHPLIRSLLHQKIDYDVYNWQPGERPDTYDALIRQLVRKRLMKRGQL